MSNRFALIAISLLGVLASGLANAQSPQVAGTWPIEKLQSQVPAMRWTDQGGPIQSLVYSGLPIDGKPTEVFAFYASPRTLGNEHSAKTFPGVVLIHGGGGTAFSDWVMLWAKRGYAAIAMDLSGRQPPAPKYDSSGKKVFDVGHPKGTRLRLKKGGLDHTHAEKFDSIGGSIDNDWPFHAAANVIAAHTLLRSFPEVDAERTAVTGISWGGYTTCLVASLDNRFKAAVPVYGCGFLHEGESVQKPSIDQLGKRRDDWVAAYDPSSHLAKCTVPTLWVNGTNDKHYVLDSYAKSYGLVQGAKTIRIEPMMRHGHVAGWEPIEIGIYIDSFLAGGVPLPAVGKISLSDGSEVTTTFASKTKIVSAALHYTSDVGLRSKRKWNSIAAVVGDGTISAAKLPTDANTYLMAITDDRGAMVSSAVGFRE